MPSRHQLLAIGGGIALFLVLLFAFDTKPPKLKQQEQERAMNRQATSIDILRKEAMEALTGGQRAEIQVAMGAVSDAEDDDQRVSSLQELSRRWYSAGQYAMAGHYAEEIARIRQDGDSWGIAGTTYGIGVTRSQLPKEKELCRDRAIEALDKATSLSPDIIDHQLNKGVILAEYPLSDNPMKGILILIDLNKKYPESVPVINNLAKFALRTNQTDRALVRLKSALELEPNNITTNCLLAQLYATSGDANLADQYARRCEELKS